MQSFRNLTNNIFFKIFLSFIALSFVLFGVSGFILGDSGTWVAKIGGKTISQSAYLKEVQKNKNMILQSGQGEKAAQYLDSQQFQSDVLNRMVNVVIVEKLRDELGVQASKNLILKQVANDENFKGSDGKFDEQLFERFLSQNGVNVEQYVKLVQSEVAAAMVVQTLAMSAPVNEEFVIAQEEYKQQTRVADLVKITDKNIKKVTSPSHSQLSEFYDKNKMKNQKQLVRRQTRKLFLRIQMEMRPF